MSVDADQVRQAVDRVVEPEIGVPLAGLEIIRDVRVRRHRAAVVLALPTSNWPDARGLAAQVGRAAESIPGIDQATVDVEVMTDAERMALRTRLRIINSGGSEEDRPAFLRPESSTRVIGVSSGKGGVGKSSVTVNLAISLAARGYQVGILDADVYGFSVPKMLGADHEPTILGDLVVPALAHGVRCLSMGFFVPDDQPVIWRGPMLHKAIAQFLSDAFWGEPDFLLVDMPPGTGDVTLSLSEVLPRTEVLVVTTPQAAAQRVAQRSAFAARKLKLSVRGVIENMSWFTGDDGTRYEIFGAGGGEQVARDLGVPLLGQVPLVPRLREGGDTGIPVTVSDPDGEPARAFGALADRVAALGPARVYRQELSLG